MHRITLIFLILVVKIQSKFYLVKTKEEYPLIEMENKVFHTRLSHTIWGNLTFLTKILVLVIQNVFVELQDSDCENNN